MLASAGPRQKEARAPQLRAELDDVLSRVARLDDEARFRVSLHLADYARQTRETFGAFETIPAETKVAIAQQLAGFAREAFERDKEQSYAYFILSALYESVGLPGEEAEAVKTACAEYVLAAVQAERSLGREA
jgi:hypothetical protein